MGDIGTKADWASAQRVFIFSGVPKGMGVSTEQRLYLLGKRLPHLAPCGFLVTYSNAFFSTR
jgi:hypothetical protein